MKQNEIIYYWDLEFGQPSKHNGWYYDNTISPKFGRTLIYTYVKKNMIKQGIELKYFGLKLGF